MAIIIYSNAIVEEMRPKNLVFTEDELINVFSDTYHTMLSKRILEIPNSWAVWGLMDNPPENEYNLIGSDLIDEDIDSPLLVIHDSEINPDWKLTDEILQKGYNQFLTELSGNIHKLASDAVKVEQEKINNGEKSPALISLKQIGITNDKKLIFSFDINIQNEQFFKEDAFVIFSDKMVNYIAANFIKNVKKKTPFIIFDDNKTVVIINDAIVEGSLTKFIEIFQSMEKYENCKVLTEVKEKWIEYYNLKNKKVESKKIKNKKS